MLFLNDLYTLQSLQQEADSIEATLRLNAEHPIFAGHFPGQPVLPGVCMVQAVSDVLEQALGRPLRLQQAPTIKFTNVVNPQTQPLLLVKLQLQNSENNAIRVDAQASRNGENCLKMKGLYA